MSHIDELVQQMTIEEKISMLAGADLWHSVAVPRLGIHQFRVTDGPNGARGSWGSMGPSSVATPVGIALGATWNPDIVEKVGNVLGDELKAKGAHILSVTLKTRFSAAYWPRPTSKGFRAKAWARASSISSPTIRNMSASRSVPK